MMLQHQRKSGTLRHCKHHGRPPSQMETSVVLLLVLGCAVGVTCQVGDSGIDRPFGDRPGMPVSATSAADCALRCENDGCVCVGWSFAPSGSKCWLKAEVMPVKANSDRISGVKDTSLLPNKFNLLPLGQLKPEGWLKEQLVTQAEGLSGHLPDFWADVANSSWVGGDGDTGLHERTPYWLNGFVPLAYQLDDPALVATALRYIDYILAHQQSDGWLGPVEDRGSPDAIWARMPLMMALLQYHQANATDARIVPAVMNCLHALRANMIAHPMTLWSAARWQDLVLVIHYLMDHHHVVSVSNSPVSAQRQFLYNLADLAHDQGYDWKNWFDNKLPTKPVLVPDLYTHGVNNGQAIKSEGVWYRQSRSQDDLRSSMLRMQKLDEYHGQASGIFGCDEHLAGNMPSRGAELCTVVESMFSYETLFSVTGDPVYAERAEMLAYNALPATISADMWSHQYLQQANQVDCKHDDPKVWGPTDGPDAILFGLEPNFGCCTANFNQGWPKFVQSLVMVTGDGQGFALTAFGPVSAKMSLKSGTNVSVNVSTGYPFTDDATIVVNTDADTTLYVRIPSWAHGTTLTCHGGPSISPTAGTMAVIDITKGSSECLIKLAPTIRTERRYNNALSVRRGGLLYALHLPESWKKLKQYQFDSADWQVDPAGPWNFGVVLYDSAQPEASFVFNRTVDGGGGQVTSTGGAMVGRGGPFDASSCPVSLTADFKRLPQWILAKGSAAPPPTSPMSDIGGDTVTMVMLPYGAARLRIAELPTIEKPKSA